MSEHTAEKDAAIAAVERLSDQAFHTAGDLVGRARVVADRATVIDALTRVFPPARSVSPWDVDGNGREYITNTDGTRRYRDEEGS